MFRSRRNSQWRGYANIRKTVHRRLRSNNIPNKNAFSKLRERERHGKTLPLKRKSG
jgi:hypothetical protein